MARRWRDWLLLVPVRRCRRSSLNVYLMPCSACVNSAPVIKGDGTLYPGLLQGIEQIMQVRLTLSLLQNFKGIKR